MEQPTAAPAPLTAHGVVEPVVRARVGTQGGAVVRALSAAAGVKVEGQQELAVVQGPSGAEVLTACHRAVDEVEERMLSTLTAAQAAAFRGALERCVDALAEGAR